jgi:hypothetical protein
MGRDEAALWRVPLRVSLCSCIFQEASGERETCLHHSRWTMAHTAPFSFVRGPNQADSQIGNYGCCILQQ